MVEMLTLGLDSLDPTYAAPCTVRELEAVLDCGKTSRLFPAAVLAIDITH
jgi:hypothetical protein